MKLKIRSLVTIRLEHPVGNRILWSLITIARCSVLALFIWVAAHNEGRSYYGEKYFTTTAKVLAYPVYLIEKPLFSLSGKFQCLYDVPERLGLAPYRLAIAQIIPLESQGPWRPDGITVNQTPFFNRGFACNLVFISFWYFWFFAFLRWVHFRLRPNP